MRCGFALPISCMSSGKSCVPRAPRHRLGNCTITSRRSNPLSSSGAKRRRAEARQRCIHIRGGRWGSEGDAQPADSGAEANAAADTEPAIDPAAFDAALRDSEYVPESADDAPPFDIPGWQTIRSPSIKPVGKARTAKNKRAPAPNRSSRPSPVCMRYSAKATTNLILSANSENRSGTLGYVWPTAAVRGGGVSELGDEASEADITLSVSRERRRFLSRKLLPALNSRPKSRNMCSRRPHFCHRAGSQKLRRERGAALKCRKAG